MTSTAHTFHIPVMGTGFTIDTPIKVARYGISSVISLVDDILIEQVRKYYCQLEGEPYEEIRNGQRDFRALRITAYLNLVNRLVCKQSAQLQADSFKPGSDITRYFELLPEGSLKTEYRTMLATVDPSKKTEMENHLREQAVPGSIDVNIMTKLDRNATAPIGEDATLFSDAMSALRGFANSDLSSSIVFSAGMNQHLYSYSSQLADFLPANGTLPKKSIILKVSDYRSAEIQGKFLAKRGLWVSEYRIESGLNCGGHAFANKGYLMGPILEEFKQKKTSLRETVFSLYSKALKEKGIAELQAPSIRITVQGGIGTFQEDEFLRNYYEVDATGWGTPFLLVPEATNVDEYHLHKLAEATEEDVYLSDSSPLNVPFWMLRTSKSEELRIQRIQEGKAGSPCVKGFLVSNTEFTKNPICHASYAYQKLKTNDLAAQNISEEKKEALRETLSAKSCICHDLAGSATVKYNIDPTATTTICCGPNIAYFSKIATLNEMVDHIYGRISLITRTDRKQMFIQELKLYINYFNKEIRKASVGISDMAPKYFHEFKQNMLDGIQYYSDLASKLPQEIRAQFLEDLEHARNEVSLIFYPKVAA